MRKCPDVNRFDENNRAKCFRQRFRFEIHYLVATKRKAFLLLLLLSLDTVRVRGAERVANELETSDQTADFRRFLSFFVEAKDRSTNREESESATRLDSTLIDAGGAFDFGDRGLLVTNDCFPFDRDLVAVHVEILWNGRIRRSYRFLLSSIASRNWSRVDETSAQFFPARYFCLLITRSHWREPFRDTSVYARVCRRPGCFEEFSNNIIF